MKKKSLILLPILLSIFLSACAGGKDPSTPSNPDDSGPSESEEQKQDFTGVTFESDSCVYDGKPHILSEVVGAPENTTITYTGRNEYINVGTYNATAKLVKEGYNDKVLQAALTIIPATFTNLIYESKIITYDGEDHFNDIQLVGALPEGTTTNETVRNEANQIVTSAIDVGTYTYTCVITNSNFETLTLNATLKINAQKKNMPVFIDDKNNIYFSNGLHNGYLYSYSNNQVNLIDYNSPKEFNKYSPSSALFIANSVFQNAVKEVGDETSNTLYTDGNIDDFVKQSDTVFYYSSNSITSKKSGIYKVNVSENEESIVTKIFEGKSDNLAINGNYLYFTNGNDNNYVYKLNLSNNVVTLVMEEKVHEFIIHNDKLYCTVNNKLNDYVGFLDLSKSSVEPTKLTNAAGEFLTIKNGYLYYNYTDLFSSIDESRKGIWRINVSGGVAEQLLVHDGISGFDVESSTSLVYVDTTDLHLYRYNTSTKTHVDLLADFVVPEATPLNTGGRTISLGTKIYYLDMYAGKTLCCYDEITKEISQLTTNKVEDFYIYNGTMYFNQVSMFTNNDLYSIDLLMGGEAIKLNTNDVRDMVSDGTYLYATHHNFLGTAGGLSRMKLDGSEYVKFSEINGGKNLTIRDNKLYYINNGYIEYISLSDILITSEELKLEGTRLSKNIKNVKQFAFDGDDIFYIYDGAFENSIRRTDFTSLDEGIAIASKNTNPSEFLLSNGYVYYYSYAATAAGKAGFYKVSKTASKDETYDLIAGYDSKYYGTSLSISESGCLYFLNYIPDSLALFLGDAHFYQLNLTSKLITKIN